MSKDFHVTIDTSAKIRLITFITQTLSKEPWTTIDLTLQSYGLDWDGDWNGTDQYVSYAIRGARDETLIALGSHLGYQSVSPSLNSPLSFWTENHFRLFISHVAKWKKEASALQRALKDFYISGFVAHVDIEPTKEWQDEIEKALQTCDALVALLTPDFHASLWTDQEIGAAIGRGVFILPLRYGQDPYGFIAKYQALTLQNDLWSWHAKEIFKSLANNPSTHSRIAECVLSAFEQSGSWEGTRGLMGLLEEFKSLDHPQLERILATIDSNLKVKDSWGVPGRARALVQRLRNVNP
jgi:hypothetical protein